MGAGINPGCCWGVRSCLISDPNHRLPDQRGHYAALQPERECKNQGTVGVSAVTLMFMDGSLDALLTASVLLLLLCALYLFRRANRPPLPPGPRGLPFGIGNMFDLPKHSPWHDYAQMGERWGAKTTSSYSSFLNPLPTQAISSLSPRLGKP